jgi:hypothetical protein
VIFATRGLRQSSLAQPYLVGLRYLDFYVSACSDTHWTVFWIELPDRQPGESRRVARAVKCCNVRRERALRRGRNERRREHEELARDLGLDRPPVGLR